MLRRVSINPPLGEPLRFRRLNGREELSQPSAFEIDRIGDRKSIDPNALPFRWDRVGALGASDTEAGPGTGGSGANPSTVQVDSEQVRIDTKKIHLNGQNEVLLTGPTPSSASALHSTRHRTATPETQPKGNP